MHLHISVGTAARRVSIHRATTVGPRTSLCQVILKNTTTCKETSSTTAKRPIKRSQSLLTTNSRAPVLAPTRGDRARLEATLADVWSRKVLPFPGITTRSRSEHLVRSSATTMMRKLSVANITSSLSRRSTSVPSMAKATDEILAHIDPTNLDVRSRDGSAYMSDDDAGESSKPKLPSIRDRSERSCSAGSGSSAANDGTFSGTVRKFDLSRLDTAWPLEDEGISAPALRASSANGALSSPQRSPTSKSDASTSSFSPGKENLHQKERKQERSPLSNVKSPSKWSRVSTMHRGTVASSLRSFFR